MRRKNGFGTVFVLACALALAACAPGEGGTDHEIEWELVTAEAAFAGLDGEYRAVVFRNLIWLVNGDYYPDGDQVWNSANGVEWNHAEVSLPSMNGRSCLVFDDKIWAFPGFYGDELSIEIWNSDDGLDWDLVSDEPSLDSRARAGVADFDGRMWIVGGLGDSFDDYGRNDVWSSTDGEVWERRTAAAGFSPRYQPGVLAFDGKLWVIGGGSWDEYGNNDVWWSEDGASWTPATEHAAFPPRCEHAVVAHDGAMWVIGGYGEDGVYYNDSWWSTDGIEWHQSSAPAPFSSRRLHEVVEYDGSIWVIGGRDEDQTMLYDVWRSR